MFAKASLLIVTFLLAFVSASPLSHSSRDTQCNTGAVQCCNSLEETHTEGLSMLASLLHVNVEDVQGKFGLGCSPITAVGGGRGAKWSVLLLFILNASTYVCHVSANEPVCCKKNNISMIIPYLSEPQSLISMYRRGLERWMQPRERLLGFTSSDRQGDCVTENRRW